MSIRLFWLAAALLIFVLPIPGTIALRNSLLLLLLVLTGGLWFRTRGALSISGTAIRSLAAWLAILTGWIVIQAVLISDETPWALKEMTSQWLPALLVAVVAAFAVILASSNGVVRARLLGIIALLFVGQAVFCLLATFPEYLANGAFPQSKTSWTAGKLEISYWNNIALAFLAVDLLSRWRYRHPMTNLSTGFVVGSVLLILLANLAFGARNGIIGSCILLVSLTLLIVWHERNRVGLARTLGFVLIAGGLIGAMAWGSIKLDPRWATFTETAKIAWNVKDHQTWLHPDDMPLPELSSGVPVEASAYMRIAWISVGLDVIRDYPLGVGYGRNAFGHALRKTQATRLGHAHSGLVDWTIGTGIPGLILWLGFTGALIWLGLRRYFQRHDPVGLILAFVAGGFLGRMLLDSINRDHMLMVFFMIIAVLISLPEEKVSQ